RDRLQPPSVARVHLAFAVPKGKRLHWLLEKATELAAASLQPVLFERSVAGGDELTPARRSRWLGHCIAAAKQCGLNFLPELRQPASLEDYLRTGERLFSLVGSDDESAASLPKALASCPREGEVRILIGPEGGLTEAELAAARRAGFTPVRLGATVLRIETAAVALLAAVRAFCD
ncbi:MAG: RNA methyltransferase, partial [Phycisphaerae bacterium]|nr:RNA methyltransferase [Phycisphaerae bacterium]